MGRKFFLASTCFIVLASCMKDIDLSFDDIDFSYVPIFSFSFSDSLTSNKTFKMKVLEQSTNLPVGGIKLKFNSDSLVADANGEISITGRNVASSTCLLSHP